LGGYDNELSRYRYDVTLALGQVRQSLVEPEIRIAATPDWRQRLAAAGTAAPRENRPIPIKFSQVATPDSPKGRAIKKFRELVEARAKGTIRVEVYPASQLYRDKEEMEALQLGAVQMIAPSLSRVGLLRASSFEIFDLPFLFPNEQAVHALMQGPIGQHLFLELREEQLLGLAFWENGFRMISADRPIRKPHDLKGLKMLIQTSKIEEAQMKQLGAVAVTVTVADITRFLSQGKANGIEAPPINILTQSLVGGQKFGLVTNHGYQGYVVIMNANFWDSLPGSARTLLEESLKEATAYFNQVAAKRNQAALASLQTDGKLEVYQPSPAEMTLWRVALRPLYRDVEKEVGPEFLGSVVTELKRLGFPTPHEP